MNELATLNNAAELVSPIAINEQLTRAELDMQIATARAYPRNIGKCVDNMTSMATLNVEIAQSCFYSIPRGGKTIDGPSVRLAETVAMNWGHVRAASRILEVGHDYLIAEGACHDLQNNNLMSVQVRRRITNREGERYNDDMINVTAMAASAIAFRNAVFKVVPRTIWEPVYRASRQLAIGNIDTLEERRDKAFAYFDSLGVTEERVLLLVDRTGVEEITLKDLGVLIGVASGIRNGELTPKDAFPEPKPDASQAIASAQRTPMEKPATPDAPVDDASVEDAESDEDLPDMGSGFENGDASSDDVNAMAEKVKAKANEAKKPAARRSRKKAEQAELDVN